MNLDKKEILAKHMANWMVQGKTPGSKHHLEAMQEYAEEYAKGAIEHTLHLLTEFERTGRNISRTTESQFFLQSFKESLKK